MKKINIIFVDEHNSSKQNGIGTYRDVLLPLLGHKKDFNIILISFNSDCFHLEVQKHDFGIEYALPFVADGNWRGSGDIIWPLLRQYIPDNDRNIFMFNHSPSALNIASMKKMYPMSKVIFIIHDQGWCASLFGDASLLAAIENDGYSAKVSEETCANVHGYCANEHAIYDISDMIVCLSESTEHCLRTIYKVPDNKIARIFNGYPTDRCGFSSKEIARRKLGLMPDDEILAFVARPVPHKGIIAILKTVEKLRKKHPRVRCALMGNPGGFLNYWEIGGKIAPNLILPGQLSQKQLRQWYSASDIGVISSYTEQCSYAALEMMNAGITIVSSDGNGLCDMFTDRQDAFVAHIGDVTDVESYTDRLAEKIEEAFSSSIKKRKHMASAARNLLRTKYSAEKMADRYADLFRCIADSAVLSASATISSIS